MPTRGTYNYSLLQRLLNIRIHGKLSSLNSSDTNIERDIINDAVRTAMSDIDFRGNIREELLSPSLTDEQFEYDLPDDVKADKIIGLRPQNTDSRGEFETYNLVSPDEFDRRKKIKTGIFTITNDDLTRRLRVSATVDDKSLTIGTLDDINSPDTWIGFGNTSDSDVKDEADDYIEGSGAVRFADTVAGAGDSIIGIQNRNLGNLNLSTYFSRGMFFVHGKLDTGDSSINSINLRLGTDSDNYYSFSDTNQNDCSAFQTGWNLLRLDAGGKTTTGTPTDTDINYAAIFWGRDSGTHLDTDFAFDYLVAKRGKYYYLNYYTRFVWQDTAFNLVENSTHDSYALLLENDEVELVLDKAAELASLYLKDNDEVNYWRNRYKENKNTYLMNNPSQGSVLTTDRYNFIHEESAANSSDTNDT